MPDSITIDSIDVSMSPRLRDTGKKPQSDTPFKILIMGDFSGRANRGLATDGSDLDQRPLFRVDRDNREALMEKMAVSIRLPVTVDSSPPVHLAFNDMDDFHPEQIFFQTKLFQSIKAVRKRLMDPDTFAETEARLSGGSTLASDAPEDVPVQKPVAKKPDFSGEATAGLLDQVLDVSSHEPAGGRTTGIQTDWDRFLGAIVRPHLTPDIEKKQDAMVAAVDRTISDTMRGILHHPDFQAVESAWRGLQFCLRRLETDEKVMVCLLNVSKTEIASDLTAHEDLRDTALYKRLASTSQQHRGDTPWALLAGMFTFSPSKADAVVLAQLGALGQILGAPFVGAAAPRGVNSSSSGEAPALSDWTFDPDPADRRAWQVLRTMPEAHWIGLALPRLMMRLPYGKETDPVDAFAFEEMRDPVNHEHYLWANPVFALVLVFGRTFGRYGWRWSKGFISDVNDLPLHLVKDRGEMTNKACAEVFLNDRALERIIAEGLMPLVSFRDQPRIRLACLQSIAEPLRPLSGRWNP
ncbi:type VI secretion system contractile sheath domain-containing protein [Desulfosarcina sp.]|uniref:type VI secretion system contractile sheath domain-containing protein n=1 Tax=Desulfosarcina sp. TaxID=2027861 RepID=UPI003970472D